MKANEYPRRHCLGLGGGGGTDGCFDNDIDLLGTGGGLLGLDPGGGAGGATFGGKAGGG